MKQSDKVFAIYNYLTRDKEGASYFFLYFFDDNGVLDQDLILRKFSEYKEKEERFDHHLIGPFISMEDLNKFAFNICDELNAASIHLLSVDDYNECMNEALDLGELKGLFVERGSAISNPDRKKDGLFGKIFS